MKVAVQRAQVELPLEVEIEGPVVVEPSHARGASRVLRLDAASLHLSLCLVIELLLIVILQTPSCRAMRAATRTSLH